MISIAHRDDKLLVLVKPSGIPTTNPDGRECLVQFARRLDASAPLLHPVSRLDAEVSGLVTFARTRSAIRQLRSARESGQYRRLYLAISSRAPQPPNGIWRASIAIDPRDRRRRVAVDEGSGSNRSIVSVQASNKSAANSPVKPSAPEGFVGPEYKPVLRDELTGVVSIHQYPPKRLRSMRSAETHYQTGEQLKYAVLLFFRPQTGRTHQIRVHASAASAPILGDRHYGGPKRLVQADGRVLRIKRVMLHCLQLVVPDLVNGGTITLSAEPPADMRNLWCVLGGSEAALDPSNARI